MKVRIKFSKEGPMKFVGHLDTMRYFQKAVRRAELPVAYSEGFSPHMIMSFAAPLGVGITSVGEYFDMELRETVPTAEIERRLNETMVSGIQVISARRVEDGKASKAMSLVAAADYLVEFREGREPEAGWQEHLLEFYRQDSIMVLKKTKKNEKEIDIKPLIYRLELQDNKIFLTLASASANYTKPELVLDTFFAWMKWEMEPFSYMVQRCEVYADLGAEGKLQLVPLQDLGEIIE